MKNIYIFILLIFTFCNTKTPNSHTKSKGVIYLSKVVNGLKMEVQIDTIRSKVDFFLTSQTIDTFYWESSIETALLKTESGNYDMLILENYNSLSSLEFNVVLSPIYPYQVVNETFYYTDELKVFDSNPKLIKNFWLKIRFLKDFKGVDYVKEGQNRVISSQILMSKRSFLVEILH